MFHKEVITEIRIDASPDHVWQTLTADSHWGAWNPFLTKVEGRLARGEKIQIVIEMPGKRAMAIQPRVLKAEPGQELRWKGRLVLPGIFDGEHYFKMERAGRGTRFIQGEHFSGLLIHVMNFEEV